MARDNVQEWDTVAGNNTDVGGSSWAEGQLPGTVNNSAREMMAQLKRAIANQGADIPSVGTCNIAATGTSVYAKVTGTTTITAFGTVNAGTMRWIEFTGILTLTHNATSLILPSAANITTAAGDVGCFVSLGSGNWKCLGFFRADGAPVSLGSSAIITSTDAGATEAPDFIADRNSASPAANDIIGGFVMRGRDSGSAVQDYARLRGKIIDPTAASEDGAAIISVVVAGTETDVLTVGPGNAIYLGGRPIGETVCFYAHKNAVNQAAMTSATPVKITFGTEVYDVGSAFASSTWTPPAGRYRVNCSVRWNTTNGVDNESLDIRLYKNGVAIFVDTVGRGGATGTPSNKLDVIVEANGTDTFEIYGTKGGAGAGEVLGSTTDTWFQGTAL